VGAGKSNHSKYFIFDICLKPVLGGEAQSIIASSTHGKIMQLHTIMFGNFFRSKCIYVVLGSTGKETATIGKEFEHSSII